MGSGGFEGEGDFSSHIFTLLCWAEFIEMLYSNTSALEVPSILHKACKTETQKDFFWCGHVMLCNVSWPQTSSSQSSCLNLLCAEIIGKYARTQFNDLLLNLFLF